MPYTDALEVLVDGTFNVVESAARHRVTKLVAASSASVYGMAEEFPTTERHHHENNDTLYGAAKTFNEGLVRSFRAMQGLDYVLLRYFNVYGPRSEQMINKCGPDGSGSAGYQDRGPLQCAHRLPSG